HSTTSRDACHLCRDWTIQPRVTPAPLEALLPCPSVRCGQPIRRWAVGVRTAPRKPPTLEWSLDSLIRAGWTEPRVFADGPVALRDRHAFLPVTLRESPIGAWPNFYLGLIELLMREPDADTYLMVEGDVVYYDRQDLRAYLEAVVWPGTTPGILSLYCPATYDRAEAGWHELRKR